MNLSRLFLIVFAGLLLMAAALVGYVFWPRPALPEGTKADRIVVFKAKRKLQLWSVADMLREYRIALGFQPVGAKQVEGDGKTPEGSYIIDWRNPKSLYHLSLHVSYPTPAQVAEAERNGVSAGGLVMIHGLRNGTGWLGRFHWLKDWTAGCMALSNEEMDELWRVVPDGTPIEIHP